MHSTARFLPASFLYYSWPFWGKDLHWPVEWGALLAAAESTMFLVFPYCSVCGDTHGSLLCHLRPGMIVLVNAHGFHPLRWSGRAGSPSTTLGSWRVAPRSIGLSWQRRTSPGTRMMRWVAQLCCLSLRHLMRTSPSDHWVLQMYLLNAVCSLWQAETIFGPGSPWPQYCWAFLNWCECGLFDAQGVIFMLEVLAQWKVDRHLEWIWPLFILLWQLWSSRVWWVSSKIWTSRHLWGSSEFSEGTWQMISCISWLQEKSSLRAKQQELWTWSSGSGAGSFWLWVNCLISPRSSS